MQSILLRILIVGVASFAFLRPTADAHDPTKRAKVQIEQLNAIIFLLANVVADLAIIGYALR